MADEDVPGVVRKEEGSARALSASIVTFWEGGVEGRSAVGLDDVWLDVVLGLLKDGDRDGELAR